MTDLATLLARLAPVLHDADVVFVTVPGSYGDHADLDPLLSVQEDEGLTLVVTPQQAQARGLAFDGVFRRITLTVHSSLHAVGLTAAVAGRLSEHGISANVVAAFHHDHVFVPTERADEALRVLTALTTEHRA